MIKENPVRKRIVSFKYAFNGIACMLRTQRNAQFHFLAAVVAVVLGIVYKIEILEWCLIIFAIGLVLTAELFNTSIEFLTDLLSPEYNQKAGRAKDIAAGAVLISAIAAGLIGLVIFIPRIFNSH
jgi:diacylglycerol kinase (ATP)